MLCLDGELDRLTLAKVVTFPEPIEEIETEVPSERLLDHLPDGTLGIPADSLHLITADVG